MHQWQWHLNAVLSSMSPHRLLSLHQYPVALRAVTDCAPGLTALQGHTNVVEDLVWQPGSAAELASVGDDYKLLFWDTRAGTTPAASLEDAHGKKDLHCVDWSSLQLELLVTGRLRPRVPCLYSSSWKDSAALQCKSIGLPGLFRDRGQSKYWDARLAPGIIFQPN